MRVRSKHAAGSICLQQSRCTPQRAVSYAVPIGCSRNAYSIDVLTRLADLHSVWDSFLIAQALRTIPANYSRPMLGALEVHLRGSIYDGYVRRLMLDGFGIAGAAGEGRFGAVAEWLECPTGDDDDALLPWPTVHTVLRVVQHTLGMATGLINRSRRHLHHKHGGEGLWNWLMGGTAGDEARWDDDVLCPYAWARDIHALNCAFPIWPAEFDVPHDVEGGARGEMGRRPRPHPELLELDTPEYAGRLREGWVVERLLAMAGIRLAGILNGLVLGEVDVYTH